MIKNALFYFRDYCDKTGIHGFQYIGERRSVFEKVLWLFFLALSLWSSAFFIQELNEKRLSSPVIVTFSTKPRPIFEIPFPAVTICPEAKVNPNIVNVNEIRRKMSFNNTYEHPITEEEKAYANYISTICLFPSFREFNWDYDFSNLNYSTSLFDTIDKIRPDFTLEGCTLLSSPFECDHAFVPVLTNEGLCYTANIFQRNDMFTNIVQHHANYLNHNFSSKSWDIEKGYGDAELDVFPSRALVLNVEDFHITLKIAKNAVHDSCKNNRQGYRVLMHSPASYPDPQRNYFRIPYSSDVVASIDPQDMNTSESLRNYNTEVRKCYFQAERKLRFFKVYTRENCKLECLTNNTLNICDCVDFYMPRDNETRICTGSETMCLIGVKHLTGLAYMSDNLLNSGINKWVINDSSLLRSCDCIPPCSEIKYKVVISQSTRYSSDHPNNDSDYYYAKISAFFPFDDFIGSERHELYGGTEFIANIGGILGLFTGFSVMSLIEIVYFVSIRLICNLRLYKNWAGAHNKIR